MNTINKKIFERNKKWKHWDNIQDTNQEWFISNISGFLNIFLGQSEFIIWEKYISAKQSVNDKDILS